MLPTCSNYLAKLLFLSGFVVISAHAGDNTTPQNNDFSQEAATPHALSPTQISVIRMVGRNILAAKKSGQEDGSDKAQLDNLKNTVDQLISVQINSQSVITPVSEQAAQTQDRQQTSKLNKRDSEARDTAFTHAKDFSKKLRQQNESRMALTAQSPELEAHSAGLPVGTQRAAMFQKWADKLDDALAQDDHTRMTKLIGLRMQLQSVDGQVSEAPYNRGTPTLQAMPSGYTKPTDSDTKNKE